MDKDIFKQAIRISEKINKIEGFLYVLKNIQKIQISTKNPITHKDHELIFPISNSKSSDKLRKNCESLTDEYIKNLIKLYESEINSYNLQIENL